jgi:uncharacterized protein YjbJ (UPF0337 family)
MKSSTKDQVQGKLHEIKGAAKEIAGKLVEDQLLVAEGSDEKLAGTAQKKIGQIEKVLGK